MFDFAWTEIALIGVVALIAIGPKDMPVAIRTVTSMIKKARRMAAEFQTHVDEMVKDADLQEVRNSISEIRSFDFKGAVEKAVDPDGSLRSTLATNPLDPVIHASAPAYAPTEVRGDGEIAELVRDEAATVAAEAQPEGARESEAAATDEPAPEFIPPGFAVRLAPAPDFVPPGTKRPPVRA